MDVLTRIPAIRWLSAGQLDAMTDNVMKVNISMQSAITLAKVFAINTIILFKY